MATFNINSYQGKSNYALTNTFMHMVYQYVNEVRCGCRTHLPNFNEQEYIQHNTKLY